MPDIYEHNGFRIAATVITHVGFFAKAILYGSMGMFSVLQRVMRSICIDDVVRRGRGYVGCNF